MFNDRGEIDISLILMVIFAGFIALYLIALMFGTASQSISGIEGMHNETDPTAFDKADSAASTGINLMSSMMVPIVGIGAFAFIYFTYLR